MQTINHSPSHRPVADGSPQIVQPAVKTDRNSALDFTKGALVLFMVLYHWINYFVATYGDFFRYLRFVTPSFIFITGFLVSNVYLARYSVSDTRLPKRLALRGLKIIGLFIVLNVIISLFFSNSYSGRIYFGDVNVTNLVMIYVSGNVDTGGSKAAAFYILLPIGYLLLLSAALVLVGRAVKRVFMIASAFSLAGVAALRLFGYESANLGLVAIGLLGVLAGYAPLERISSVARRSMLLVAAYGLYLCALTAWDALYPLQIVGVVLSLLLMYSLGLTDADEKSGWLRGHIIRLGQYSLYSYITQIAMLQVLNKAVRNVERGPLLWVASFIAAFVLTSLAVELADWARKRSRPLNEVYKAVFA